MEETLKLIPGELEKVNTRLDRLDSGQKELKISQDQLQKNQNQLQTSQDQLQTSQNQLKDNLINGLGQYFEHIEKHIDAKTSKLTETLEDQQRVIDTLVARSVRHESDQEF